MFAGFLGALGRRRRGEVAVFCVLVALGFLVVLIVFFFNGFSCVEWFSWIIVIRATSQKRVIKRVVVGCNL